MLCVFVIFFFSPQNEKKKNKSWLGARVGFGYEMQGYRHVKMKGWKKGEREGGG